MTLLDQLEPVLAPIGEARGLPNAHYISDEIYARERDTVFFKNWAAIGFDHDAAQAGDAVPVDFMGMPLLLVRTRSGELNVFQNTCRHRGMILVEAPTRLKGPIRCPYHSWCYSEMGDLVRTPFIGGLDIDSHEAVKPETLSLFKIRSHVWQGVVFVNISGDAPAFEIAHADLIARWGEFDQSYYPGGAESQFEMTLASNWKLAVENYCESYHLPWIHPELNKISPIDVHYNIDNHPDYSGQGTRNYRQLVGKNGQTFPDFEGLSGIWDKQGEYVACFPNILLGVHRDHAFAMLLIPKGPDVTHERVSLFYAKADIKTAAWQDMCAENARIWQGVFQEDIGVVEGMQKGRYGVKFDGGKFSPVMDGPTHNFHKWVATQYLQNKP